MIELNVTDQTISVVTTEQSVNINVNTSVVDVNSTSQIVDIEAATGIIYTAMELAGLSDVAAANPNDGDVLQYIASTDKWTKTSSINFGTW